MPQLRVPVALDQHNNLVRPSSAEQGRRYVCPACREAVIVKKGTIKIHHFAHNATDTCSQESILHKTAKLLIQQTITDWKSGTGPAPRLMRECTICYETGEQPLPDTIETAVLERKLADGSIVDIALCAGQEPKAAIEIKVTNEVDDTKSKRLPVSFIELDGSSVIEDPHTWTPTKDHFKPFICPTCRGRLKPFRTKAERIATAIGIELPKSYYRYSPWRCYKCQREILVFTWPGHALHAERPPQKGPIPKTITHRFSRTTGTAYWVNTCPHCTASQGDFFLHAQPDGPFFDELDCEDTPESFRLDCVRIAFSATELGLIPNA